ncbi:hypothetical protein [Modestobacter sp. I12A-02662]|uniref:hypothetical protein n=1 Tax=Modestobacter sp. I12A-02662 TaxID=1730496 RepID=UPI0034DEF5D3
MSQPSRGAAPARLPAPVLGALAGAVYAVGLGLVDVAQGEGWYWTGVALRFVLFSPFATGLVWWTRRRRPAVPLRRDPLAGTAHRPAAGPTGDRPGG